MTLSAKLKAKRAAILKSCEADGMSTSGKLCISFGFAHGAQAQEEEQQEEVKELVELFPDAI